MYGVGIARDCTNFFATQMVSGMSKVRTSNLAGTLTGFIQIKAR